VWMMEICVHAYMLHETCLWAIEASWVLICSSPWTQ
jgi:hypothetical protein